MECPSCNAKNHGNRKTCSSCGITFTKSTSASQMAQKPLRLQDFLFINWSTEEWLPNE